MNCQICNRPLNNPNDPLSLDCGGDCWGCIGQIEADSGYKPSIEAILQEEKIRELGTYLKNSLQQKNKIR
jgi:hypothetical protein